MTELEFLESMAAKEQGFYKEKAKQIVEKWSVARHDITLELGEFLSGYFVTHADDYFTIKLIEYWLKEWQALNQQQEPVKEVKPTAYEFLMSKKTAHSHCLYSFTGFEMLSALCKEYPSFNLSQALEALIKSLKENTNTEILDLRFNLTALQSEWEAINNPVKYPRFELAQNYVNKLENITLAWSVILMPSAKGNAVVIKVDLNKEDAQKLCQKLNDLIA